VIRAILFDHDGTLVDSEATHLALWREVVAPYGVQIDAQAYWQQMLGVPMEQNAANIVQRYRLEVAAADLVAAKQAANARFLANSYFPEMSGASAWLSDLRVRTRLALVSGSTRDCVDASLHGHGWHGLFEQVVSGDDVSRNKPYPDGYLRALQAMQLPATQGIAVEDTEVGVQAARAAGLRVVAIRNPLASGHDFSQAERVFASLAEACQWLDSQLPH